MEKYFKTEEGKLVDILDYSVEQIAKNPNVKIHIGTDSQVKGKTIFFVPCIVYRVGTRGAHFIFKRIEKKRPPKSVSKEDQVNQRLTEEIYMTMEIASYLTDNSAVKIDTVEFDFNDQPEHISNKLTSLATGWAKGLGFNTKIKPEQLIACRASDHLCKK